MAYFRELPNIQYIGNLPNQTSNEDYLTAKNIFKRAKLREDLKNIFTVFDYYYIKEGERPDQIATKIYNDPQLDWIILITNNITDIRDQWPLDDTSFYRYLLNKYGSESNFTNIHHYETDEKRDEYDRLVVPSNLQVDPPLNISIVTGIGVSEYPLPNFLNSKSSSSITVNLNQVLNVKKRSGITSIFITDNHINYSYFPVTQRSNTIPITVINSLDNWPTSWGGAFNITTRNANNPILTLPVIDIVYNNDISITPNLYEITYTPNVGPVFRLIKK